MDISKEIGTAIGFHQSGAPIEVAEDETGMRYSRLQEFMEDSAAVGPAGYRDVYAMSEAAGAPVTEAEIGGTMAGFGPGKVAGVVGAPGDIAALATGLYKAAFPDADQGRLDAFIQQVEEVSNKFGSGATLGFLDDMATKAGVPEDVKQGFMQGAEVGSFFGLGQGAVATGKGVAAAGRAVAEGAPARIAERGEGVTLGMGVDPMAPIDEAIVAMSKKTPSKTPDDLVNILNIKAKQMELSPEKRIQPSGQNPLFDATPEGYERTILEQKETPVPRAPEGKALPKGNRAAILIEKADKITDQMAENIRPHLGSKVRYFYHTGPLIDKAKELGVPENVARDQLKKFALNYAATSPRKPTEENLRVASVVSAKESRGIDYRDIIGPGTGGVSEAGYPMMVNPGGIHAKLIDAVRAGGIDFDTNPKPATFAENVAGNLQGVTADTHAIRGVLDALNKAEPGSIPKEWFGDTIQKQNKLYEAYKKNPNELKPEKDTLPGSLASQKIDGVSKQTEYAVISDLYKMTAEKLGITPAEAQALHWFTQGERTGLVSEPKTIIDIIEERIDVTAQALDRPKEEVFVDFFSGKIPLLSLGGLTLLDTGATIDDQDGEEM